MADDNGRPAVVDFAYKGADDSSEGAPPAAEIPPRAKPCPFFHIVCTATAVRADIRRV